MFWLTALVLGIHSTDPVTLLAWILAVFVGVLIHELGHALVMRGYGFYPEILLYGLGGATDYGYGGSATFRLQPIHRIQISAAGPAAGFLLAAAVVLLVRLLGGQTDVYWLLGFIPIPILESVGSKALTAFFQSLVYIGVFWGLINLMPVFPLDGGQIAREILLAANPRTGMEQSLALSFYCALFLAFVGFFALSSLFMTLLFGYLAYNSYELMRGRARPW
jgi:Zn-dependent protease